VIYVAGDCSVSADLEIIVCTRDSASWIAPITRAWYRLGRVPTFVVDARTSDKTRQILRHQGVEFTEVVPEYNRVEDILWRVAQQSKAKWILRIDDDEMPSEAMLRWIDQNLPAIGSNIVMFPRRWCWLDPNGFLVYTQAKNFYWMPQHPNLIDPQARLFRPEHVQWQRDIHTPGFVIENASVAPPEAFFCHFDWIVRNLAARLQKLSIYDAQQQGAGSDFSNFYIPERRPLEELCLTRFSTNEFDRLARDLHPRLLSQFLSRFSQMWNA
jgi:hypothetical protein